MPSKKKKYNARFPAGRIKKIMQTDEEVGKVAQAVPVIISRTLELFVESLIKKSMEITKSKNARTLSPHHMKLCILSESRFDFLRDLVKGVPEGPSSDDDLNLPESSASSQSRPERRDSVEGHLSSQPPSVPPPPCEPTGQPNFPSFYKERSNSIENDPSIPSPSLQQPIPESAKINNTFTELQSPNSNNSREEGVLIIHSDGNSEDDNSDDYDT